MLRGTIHSFIILIILVATAVSGSAQTNIWLKRSWNGKAYALGDKTQLYNLVLNINKIKGDNFDGVLMTSPASDPSTSFGIKVSGIIHERYLLISMPGWKVKCGNCAPQNLELSIESGKLFLKGEAKGCPLECTWVTEFSIDMSAFESSVQQSLYATVQETENPAQEPATDVVPVAKTPPPVKDTATVVKVDVPQTKRIILLPPGNIVPQRSGIAKSYSGFYARSLTSRPSLQLKPPVIVETRIPLLKADIATLAIATPRIPNPVPPLVKDAALKIIETEPPRVSLLPAGNVVASGKTKTPSREEINNQSLQNAVTMQVYKKTQSKTNPPKDTVEALPVDYGTRKKNVIRTLKVDTDSVLLRVYDNGVVDGDIVSVIYNDKVVMDKLTLTSHAVEVKIPVNKIQTNTLVFHAHNLGELPPNTAKLEIIYGNKKEELTVSSDLTVSSTIDIVRE